MEIISRYIPHERQVEAHCAEEQFVGYGGAMGGGKTRWLCEVGKQLSIDYPGNFGLICRASGPALKQTVLEMMFSEVLIPGSKEWEALGCDYNKMEGVLTFGAIKTEEGSPSRIWFTGLDNANTERLKSLNLGFFGIEEATEVPESVFIMLATRLRRKSVPRIARKGIITANPEAGWIKRRFVDQKLPNHKFVFANYKDNPHLPEDYEDLFETLPQRWKDKYLLGNWDAASGLIYKEFDPDFHIIPSFTPPQHWLFLRGLDHGQQNPCACVGAASTICAKEELEQYIGDRVGGMHPEFEHYPVIFFYRLYYSPGLVSEHRERIWRTFPELQGRHTATFADPSIWARDREKMVVEGSGSKAIQYSVGDEYMETPYPLIGMQRANNSVLAGIDRFSTLLKIGHVFFVEGPTMEPLIGAAGEIRNYSWENPPQEGQSWPEKPKKMDDHALDACRYLLMSFPSPQAQKMEKNPWSFDEVRRGALAWRAGRDFRAAKEGGRIGWRS